MNHNEMVIEIYDWIMNKEDERGLVVTGGPGAGKTRLIKQLQDYMDTLIKIERNRAMTSDDPFGVKTPLLHNNDIFYTYTINSMSDVYDEEEINHEKCTVFSLLNFTVTYSGKLRYKRSTIYEARIPTRVANSKSAIVLIDEANYISEDFFALIDEYYPETRFIFFGDPNQLSFNEDGAGAAYTKGFKELHLSTLFRPANDNVREVFLHTLDWFSGKRDINDLPNNKSVRYLTDESKFIEQINRCAKSKYSMSVQAWRIKRLEYLFTQANKDTSVRWVSEAHKGRVLDAKTKYISNFDQMSPTQQRNLGAIKTLCSNIKTKTGNSVRELTDSVSSMCKTLRNQNNCRINCYIPGITQKRQPLALGSINVTIVPYEFRTTHSSMGLSVDYTFLDLRDIRGCPQTEVLKRMMLVGFTRHKHGITILI